MKQINANAYTSEPTLFDVYRSSSIDLVAATQRKLLERCIRKSVNVEIALRDEGLTYDDLRYEHDEPLANTARLYRELSSFETKPHQTPIISFFSGAGGLDLGFEAAGYTHLALVEINEVFCETIRLNRPNWRVFGPPIDAGDVSEVEAVSSQIRSLVGTSKFFDGIFVGGPPCQPFSIAANQRFSKTGDNFKRIGYAHGKYGNLLFKYINLIIAFRPRAFLIENVPGLFDVDGGEQLHSALEALTAAGYRVEKPFILNASKFLVPQQRLRLFIVGSRNNSRFIPPIAAAKLIPCASVFSMPTTSVANHETRKHKADSILRYMKLNYGERDHLGRVDRLNPHVPSKTVIAGGTKGGGRSHLHPRIPRTISVREAARLQTFPDNYIFTGPVARQFTQVGNAVPPVLAAQLANSLSRSYFS